MVNNDFSSDDFDKLLDDFIANQLKDAEDTVFEAQEKGQKPSFPEPKEEKPKEDFLKEDISTAFEQIEKPVEKKYSYYDYMTDFSNESSALAMEEKRLYEAIINLIKAAIDCAKEADDDSEIEFFNFNINNLLPRFSPRRTKNLTDNITYAWSLLLNAQPEELSKLVPNASDEQILSFAEQASNKNLVMALISYVETLIEIDSCEIAYKIGRAHV